MIRQQKLVKNRNLLLNLLKQKRGVSPILATVIIFGLIITGVMITFIQIVPYIEQAQSEETVATVSKSFVDLDANIVSLISESGTLGGFRTALFNKPSGRIDYDPSRCTIAMRLLDQDGNLVYNIFEPYDPIDGLLELSILDWVYNSPRSILPRGSSKYLTGPDPYQKREQIILTGPFASSDYQDLTNLSLSHLNDRRHHITLNYRISVHLTMKTNPEPEIKFQIFIIQISADFESLYSQYKQFTIQANQNFSTPYTLPQNDSISALELVWDNIRVSGTKTTSLWSTQSIQGLSQVSYFKIVVQTLMFKIGITSS